MVSLGLECMFDDELKGACSLNIVHLLTCDVSGKQFFSK